jgi:hypothetical protein
MLNFNKYKTKGNEDESNIVFRSFFKVLPHFPVSNNRASCQWVIFFMYIVATK